MPGVRDQRRGVDLRAVNDSARPVCVILGAVLHFLDPDAACAVTAGYVSLLAPGGCLVLSCAPQDAPAGNPDGARAAGAGS
jgi:hypothetical protein